MDTKISKKRKHRDAEALNGSAAAITSKKTKKLKNRPPVEPEVSESEPEEDQEIEDEVEDNNDDEEEEEEDPEAEEEGDEDEMNGNVDEDLPMDGPALLPPTTTDSGLFTDLSLSEKTMTAIDEMGFKTLTQIQRSVWLHYQ